MTKNNTVRLRYSCAYAVVMLVMAGLAFEHVGFVRSSDDVTPEQLAEAESTLDAVQTQQVADASSGSTWTIAKNLQSSISGGIRKASAAIEKAAPVVTAAAAPKESQNVQLGRGDTIAGVLEEAGVSEDDAYQAVKALSEQVNPRSIRAGQVINIQFKPGEEAAQFSKMTMNVDPLKQVVVRKENDQFVTDMKQKKLQPHVFAGYARIENSLYGSAERAGIPSQALAELVRLYSRNVDFQRDIQKGDKIEVLYDGMQNEDGKYVKFGNLLYANLTIGGKKLPMYRFQGQDGRTDYYDPQGRTTRKTLLKTPVDGARISSGYGMRFHPILGYTRMHKGIDFAAPTGTPIYAAGDGTIEFEGRKNGYGNFIKLRHNSELSTGYGHMSRFASGTHDGMHVAQGDVIGYVGATGEATGPHLHYEVLVDNSQVNPRSVDLPTGENLGGKELARFKKAIGSLTQQYASLTIATKVAQVGGSSLN